MAAVQGSNLSVAFLPHFTPSHIDPLVNAARQFAAAGVHVSIITTRHNALLFQASIDHDIKSGHQISVHTLDFPSAQVGLPEGIENYSAITSPDMAPKVFYGIALLQIPMEKLIRELSPDCIFSDMFFPWTVNVAEKLKIPRLLFYPCSFFYHCVTDSLKLYSQLDSESESFLVPDLPDKIEMKRTQLEDHVKTKTWYTEVLHEIRESEIRSYGTVHDTFYELEPAYAEHYRKVKGRKIWHIGPLFFFANRDKGKNSNNAAGTCEKHSCLSWLDTRKPNSVLYVSFGSMVRFSDAQLTEIALGLEASNHPFVWVVRKIEKTQESWLPEDFEEKMMKENKGMIIRGWAPQVLVLNHPAIGGFMTHCGWNSVIEAVVAGVPLITWPLFAEQFYNEKQIKLLKIGVGVGSEVWNSSFEITSPVMGKDSIVKALTCLMGDSEKAEQIGQRAKEVAVIARRAVEEGGSSYSNLTGLIEEIKAFAYEKAHAE